MRFCSGASAALGFHQGRHWQPWKWDFLDATNSKTQGSTTGQNRTRDPASTVGTKQAMPNNDKSLERQETARKPFTPPQPPARNRPQPPHPHRTRPTFTGAILPKRTCSLELPLLCCLAREKKHSCCKERTRNHRATNWAIGLCRKTIFRLWKIVFSHSPCGMKWNEPFCRDCRGQAKHCEKNNAIYFSFWHWPCETQKWDVATPLSLSPDQPIRQT